MNSLKLVKGDDVSIQGWKSLVDENQYSSPFQTQEFYKFINAISGYSAEVFGVEKDQKIIALVVITIQKESGIKIIFSRRGIIYGGPLIYDNQEEALTFLLSSVFEFYRRKLIYIEIRNFFDYSKFRSAFEISNWDFIPYLNFRVPISSPSDDLYSAMNYNRKREIRLSLDNNAFYRECGSEQELKILYDLLFDLYRTRVKLPLPKYDFFKVLWKSNFGKVFIVIHDDRVIGGSICPLLNNKAIYTWYYCGIRDYHKRIFPTHLAVVAALKYAHINGLKYLDFMGAGRKGEEYGVRQYKQEFGGVTNEFGRYRRIINPLLFRVGELGVKILQKM